MTNTEISIYTFPLNSEEYSALLEAQEYKCAICHKRAEDRTDKWNLSVDHDHATNLVRGLLCNQCNLGLGCFLDRQSFLRSAIEYLRTYDRKLAKDF